MIPLPLTNDQLVSTVVLLNEYILEYGQCRKMKLKYGSAALLGALLETILITMCHVFPEEVEAAKVRVGQDRNLKPYLGAFKKDLLDRTLGDLCQVAVQANWCGLSESESEELFKAIRDLRNLIHPGNKIRNRADSEITEEEIVRCEEFYSQAWSKFEVKVQGAIDKDVKVDKDLFEVGGEPLKRVLPRRYWPE